MIRYVASVITLLLVATCASAGSGNQAAAFCAAHVEAIESGRDKESTLASFEAWLAEHAGEKDSVAASDWYGPMVRRMIDVYFATDGGNPRGAFVACMANMRDRRI